MTITPGPLVFEPHDGYGQDYGDPDMRMPFGYISGRGFNPLVELDHFFDCPEETLTAYAKLFAAAPELLEALRRCLQSIEGDWERSAVADIARAAIAKATA